MQVKKFEASSVIEALHEVKAELGPDAIILSTQEVKAGVGRGTKHVVVAAVSEYQLKKKELAEKKLGDIYSNNVANRTATQQKAVIENVYKNIEQRVEKKNRKITQTRYIEIDDSEAAAAQLEAPVAAPALQAPVKSSSTERVKSAAKEALQSSLSSDLFGFKKKEEPTIIENVLPQRSESFVVPEPKEMFSPHILSMSQRLKMTGVSDTIIDRLKHQAQKELGNHGQRKAIVDSWYAKWILNRVQVSEQELSRGVEVFVGPHGSGKTTALLKVATNYVVQQRKSVAIITSDVNKVGAIEHLRVYSRILNIPVYIATSAHDVQAKLYELEEYDSVLIDTPGITLGNMEELDFMKAISTLSSNKPTKIHLTISALTKSSDLGSIVKRFRVSDFDDVIVSNIDQTTQHGILINIQETLNVNYHSFGISSDIVDGFEYASRERVLDLIFKLTKMNGEKAHGDTL
ncbi:MAG: hypothetical protein HRT44_07485 [Bdellovibrionales bacterium]|nr:hypothetical protein [Bdellovibrionales bacterium]NQZ19080.1 hypothetical protein [Bdellovibrionales bacterium]